VESILLTVGNWLTLIIFLNIIGAFFFLDKCFQFLANPTRKTSLNLNLFNPKSDQDWDQMVKEEASLKGIHLRIYYSILTELKSNKPFNFLNAQSIFLFETQRLGKKVNLPSFLGSFILVIVIARVTLEIYLQPAAFLTPTPQQESLIQWAIFALASVIFLWALGAILKSMYRNKIKAITQFLEDLTEIKQWGAYY